MKDIARFSGMVPQHAEGRIQIDLKDPDTGRVRKRVEGKNHVFKESLFRLFNNAYPDAVSQSLLLLNDSDATINPDFPYVLGDTIGYGKPSTAGTGLYRGAYSAANQVLAQQTIDSVRWVFQYDFTTAQAIGTIKNIGLSMQNVQANHVPIYGRKIASVSNATTLSTQASDGTYSYGCSAAGVLTKSNYVFNTTEDMNISAIVGTTIDKVVGIDPSNGKAYIFKLGSGVNRIIYQFSDTTFSTLEATWPAANINIVNTPLYPLYFYGDKLFQVQQSAACTVNFKANVAVTNMPAPPVSPVAAENAYSGRNFAFGTMATWKYIICGSCGNNQYPNGIIVDMDASSFAGHIAQPHTNGIQCPMFMYPGLPHVLPCAAHNINAIYTNCAIAAKKLDAPVVKTSANSMTATYELEVFW